MNAYKLALILTVLGVSHSLNARQPFALGHLKSWRLALAENATLSEEFAAREFQRLFKLAVGESLMMETTSNPSKPAILIGPLDPGDIPANEEAFQIEIANDGVRIHGGRPRGTLYGVYEFFERYAGARYLTFDHTYFPPDAAERKLAVETYSHAPPFSYRNSYYRENFLHPEFAVRLRLNTFAKEEKFGGVASQNLINHSFHYQIPVEKYGREHPEYFALIDGKRRLKDGGGGPEPCVSNPEVIDIVTQSVLRELANHRQFRNISVSQNDNDKYCRCPDCEAVNQREGTPMGAQLCLVNEVAKRVENEYPGVKVGTLSYWYTRKPPKTMKPRDNVQIQLCSIECCTLHAIDDPSCEKNRAFCEDLAGWKELCRDIWIWNYNVNFSAYDRPFPNLKSIGPNVAFFRDNNVNGVFMQGAYNGAAGELSDLRNYVIARCLWKPGLNSWETAMEFCRLHYGEAAPPIIEAIELLHENAEQSGVHPGCFPNPNEVGLNAEIAARLFALYRQALSLASDETIRRRVEKASICAYRAMIDQEIPMKKTDEGFMPLTGEERREVIENYIALCKTHGLTRPGEHYTAEEFFEKISNNLK